VAIQVEQPQHHHQRVPPWRNVTFLKWAAQILFLMALVGAIWILAREAGANLKQRDIGVSFDFLADPPGIRLGEGIDVLPSTGGRAFYVGIINMMRIALAGIFAATVLGILLGVARLSNNWVVKKVATGYIEVIRNIPLLVQIIFWGAVVVSLSDVTYQSGFIFPLRWPSVLLALAALVVLVSAVRALGKTIKSGRFRHWMRIGISAAVIALAAWVFISDTIINTGCTVPGNGCEGWLFLANKGMSFAWVFPSDGFWQWTALMLIGIAASIYVYKWRIRVKEQMGRETYALSWGTLTVATFAVIGLWIHPIMGFFGPIFGALASLFDSAPVFIVQLILAGLAMAGSGWWLKNFLDSRRTPAGLAKLTDDDYFRMGSAVVAGIIGVTVAFMFTGISNWILDSGRDFFEVAESRFEWMRSGAPFRGGRPSLVQPGNFVNYGITGMTMSKLFFPVFIGVTLYTAAFIAEVVRGGIMAISLGQSEAGLALGLKRGQLLRFIVLPQAFRIILPPMGNQYLNLAKNTSLGIAVGYPEIVAVGQTLYNQTGATIPVVLMWMLFYVSVSLFISAIVRRPRGGSRSPEVASGAVGQGEPVLDAVQHHIDAAGGPDHRSVLQGHDRFHPR